MMVNEQLVQDLIAEGIDSAWLSDMISRHGTEVLDLIQKALLLGFTPEVTKDLLTVAGKIGFELLVKLLGLKMLLKGTGEVSGPDYNKAVMEVLAQYK